MKAYEILRSADTSTVIVELDDGTSAGYELTEPLDCEELYIHWVGHRPLVIGPVRRVLDLDEDGAPDSKWPGSVLILNPNKVRAIRLGGASQR